MKKRIGIVIAAIAAALLVAAGGYALGRREPSQAMASGQVTNASTSAQYLPPPLPATLFSSSSTYPLLNGVVAYDNTMHFIINFEPLEDQLKTIQARYPEKTYIYFDYLNNAASVGLNGGDLFTAASTIKVPLAMAIYKMAEEGKLSMNDNYTLDQANLDDHFGDLYNAGPDNAFTIEELVSIMLEKSDNTAMQALITILNRIGLNDPFSDVYHAMGWNYYPDIGSTPSYVNIDTKTLSNMFLSLYNATYDNPTDSEKILSYLTQTPFNDKIVAGLPSNAVVSHKIGIAAESQTYSDCGIIYAPSRPYILCVGFSGGDEATADTFIAAVSKTAYQYVINN